MGWSPLSTEVHNTSQYSSRTRAPAGVVLHHGATTSADAIISMETTGSRQVSSHQVVKDKRNAGIVQEQFRAWSLSDSYWDSWAFTVECANESTVGWTISNESHETLAQLTANWATRYGFWPHRSGNPKTWTVIGHREVYTIHGGSYATACPGGMNLDWIAARAQEIINGGGSSADITIEGDPMFRLSKRHPSQAVYIIGITGRRAHVQNGVHLGLLQRFLKAGGNVEDMYEHEFDTIRGYQVLVAPEYSANVDNAPVLAKLAEILDALGDDPDTTELLATLEQLDKSIGLIPNKTVDELAGRLG